MTCLTIDQIALVLPPTEARAVTLWLKTFFPFQLEWLLDFRELAALVKARQIGGSHTLSAWAVLRAILGQPNVIVSVRDNEAKDVLVKCKRHLECLAACGSQWANTVKDTTEEVVLASGGSIRSTTSRAAGRGFSGNVLVDEFAYFQDRRALWDAAMAVATHNFQVRICSTPNGVGDEYHELCTETGHSDKSRRDGWLIYETDIYRAIDDGMRLDLDKLWDLCKHDQRIFDQIYLCKFVDSDMQYFQSDLLDRATSDYETPKYGKTIAGLDIGETQDRTVLTVWRRETDSGKWRKVHTEIHRKTDDILISQLIDLAINVYQCTAVAVDKTGMGTFPTRAAKRKYGGKILGVNFSAATKEEMATNLYQLLVDGDLQIQSGDDSLRKDLASIRRVVTAGGTVKYEAPRTSDGHADEAWALMLCMRAAKRVDGAGAYSRLRKAGKHA